MGIVIGLVLVAAFLYDGPRSDDRGARTSRIGSSVSMATVDIGNDGDVHVALELQFSTPRDHLTLRVPEAAWAAGEFEPVVDGMTLEVDDRRLHLEDALEAGERRSVPLPADTAEVRLEYDATGTFVASTPSSPGRGLVLLTPLTVEERATLSQVEVIDDRVLNLGCVGTGELSACAIRDGEAWIASPAADADQVIAQVDLVGARQDRATGSNRSS